MAHRRRIYLNEADIQRIRDWKAVGWTWKQIGFQFDLTEKQIKEKACRLGIRSSRIGLKPIDPPPLPRITAQPVPKGVPTLAPLPSLITPMPKITGT